jgi:hypothetical protein
MHKALWFACVVTENVLRERLNKIICLNCFKKNCCLVTEVVGSLNVRG